MTENTPPPRKPEVQLTGEDGNAFLIMVRVNAALKQDGQPDRAAEWMDRALHSESYDALLQLAFEYVEPL